MKMNLKNVKIILPIIVILGAMLLLQGCINITLPPIEGTTSDEDTVKYYTVRFNTNGGNILSGSLVQEIKEGGAASAPVVENGNKALKWDADFSDIRSDLTVNAIWTTRYTVIFNPNGGRVVSGSLSQQVNEGESAEAPVIEKDGAEYVWDADFSDVHGDLSINAVWKEYFSVKFDPGEGTLVSGSLEQSVEKGSAAEAPVLEKKGFALTWDADFSKIEKDTVVHAVWTRKELTSVEVAEYAAPRTVTVNTDIATGSGFFIDGNGTIITNYHVIDGAREIKIKLSDGSSVDVKKIVKFSPILDIAVLKIDRTTDYFEFVSDGVKTGEPVYAVGASLGILEGSFTSGTVSGDRTVGGVPCYQTDASISHGNSGGPLINRYGEVIGINSFSYESGNNLYFAIKVEQVNNITDEKNWNMNSFVEWYERETSISWAVQDKNGDFYYSLVNTYQTVTGKKCIASLNYNEKYVEGYQDCYDFYAYEYEKAAFDEYVEYLKANSFEYEGMDKLSDGAIEYEYFSEAYVISIYLEISADGTMLFIEPITY